MILLFLSLSPTQSRGCYISKFIRFSVIPWSIIVLGTKLASLTETEGYLMVSDTPHGNKTAQWCNFKTLPRTLSPQLTAFLHKNHSDRANREKWIAKLLMKSFNKPIGIVLTKKHDGGSRKSYAVSENLFDAFSHYSHRETRMMALLGRRDDRLQLIPTNDETGCHVAPSSTSARADTPEHRLDTRISFELHSSLLFSGSGPMLESLMITPINKEHWEQFTETFLTVINAIGQCWIMSLLLSNKSM